MLTLSIEFQTDFQFLSKFRNCVQTVKTEVVVLEFFDCDLHHVWRR